MIYRALGTNGHRKSTGHARKRSWPNVSGLTWSSRTAARCTRSRNNSNSRSDGHMSWSDVSWAAKHGQQRRHKKSSVCTSSWQHAKAYPERETRQMRPLVLRRAGAANPMRRRRPQHATVECQPLDADGGSPKATSKSTAALAKAVRSRTKKATTPAGSWNDAPALQ